jgi:hypothetical protein
MDDCGGSGAAGRLAAAVAATAGGSRSGVAAQPHISQVAEKQQQIVRSKPDMKASKQGGSCAQWCSWIPIVAGAWQS